MLGTPDQGPDSGVGGAEGGAARPCRCVGLEEACRARMFWGRLLVQFLTPQKRKETLLSSTHSIYRPVYLQDIFHRTQGLLNCEDSNCGLLRVVPFFLKNLTSWSSRGKFLEVARCHFCRQLLEFLPFAGFLSACLVSKSNSSSSAVSVLPCTAFLISRGTPLERGNQGNRYEIYMKLGNIHKHPKNSCNTNTGEGCEYLSF